jgi:hypothetical protein
MNEDREELDSILNKLDEATADLVDFVEKSYMGPRSSRHTRAWNAGRTANSLSIQLSKPRRDHMFYRIFSARRKLEKVTGIIHRIDEEQDE